MRTPPSSTPIEPPPEATKPKTPIALARSAGSVKRVMISESETAETTAPPRPCTARAAIRNSCEVASPQASEATREERDAAEEQPPVAVEVAEPAAEQQEAAERQQVGVHDPGERRLGEAEVRPGSTAARRSRSSCRGRSSACPGRGRSGRPACAAVERHAARPFGSIGSEDGPARLGELIGRRRNSR